MNRVLLVEDCQDLRDLLKKQLIGSFEVITVSSLTQARRELRTQSFDLILLDASLPDGNSFDFCAALKEDVQFTSIPIIFLTGKTEAFDVEKVRGFSLDAHDYIAKPFDSKSLLSRMEALLHKRLLKGSSSPSESTSTLRAGALRFDLVRQRVFIQGERTENEKDAQLTPLEFKILHFLACKGDKFFSRDALLEKVTDPRVHVSFSNIYTHISSIRKKLGDHSRYIQCVPRMGYRFHDEKRC